MLICLSKPNRNWTYTVFLIKFEAAPPVDPSEVGGCQFHYVQFEGLLHEHDVVVRHAEAVEVARIQSGSERNGADLLNLSQSRFLRVFI